jgi:AraC family transcriptional regulator of adaptative response / DNA-3-methyladenine glycosylase II
MRALGNPDSFMPTDLGIRKAAAVLGLPVDPVPLTEHAERWRPWRSYALCHMWSAQLPKVVPKVVPKVEGTLPSVKVKRQRKGQRKGESAA